MTAVVVKVLHCHICNAGILDDDNTDVLENVNLVETRKVCFLDLKVTLDYHRG